MFSFKHVTKRFQANPLKVIQLTALFERLEKYLTKPYACHHVERKTRISIHSMGSISSFFHPFQIWKVQQWMWMQAPVSSPSQDAEVPTQRHEASTVFLQKQSNQNKDEHKENADSFLLNCASGHFNEMTNTVTLFIHSLFSFKFFLCSLQRNQRNIKWSIWTPHPLREQHYWHKESTSP